MDDSGAVTEAELLRAEEEEEEETEATGGGVTWPLLPAGEHLLPAALVSALLLCCRHLARRFLNHT